MSIASKHPSPSRWWDDTHFQDSLVALLVLDHHTLKQCGTLLSPEDFRPDKAAPRGRARWIVAERALEFWKKHHEPLGKLAQSDVLEYAHQLDLGAMQKAELFEYVASIEKLKLSAPDALVEKVVKFKSNQLRKNAIEELVDLHSSGQLTDEKWAEIVRKGVLVLQNENRTTDYLSTLDDRIARRLAERKHVRVPYSLIEPLDQIVPLVAPKELGMVLAPYKRGKSMFLEWLAIAYARQRLNVLYVTLEDPRKTVEDRLDAIVSHISMIGLADYPQTLTKRFEKFKNSVHGKIKIYDGTEGGFTLATLESAVGSFRDEGFIPDATLIDYDEEIRPSRKYSEKRFESDDVYRGLRQFMARYNQVGWVAAQTQRDTRNLKILSGDRVAEDIGKMRKVACGISMGKGDWTEDSIYLWVAAHKNARMEIGCEIVPDLKQGSIYDAEATARYAKMNAVPEEP